MKQFIIQRDLEKLIFKGDKTMMISEFVERTGFEPLVEEYREIEAEYMSAPEYVDKDIFCKQWKRSGNIKRLMRLRARKIEELEATLRTNARESSEIRQRAYKENERLKDKIKALENELNSRSLNYEIELREARELCDAMEQRATKAEEKLTAIKNALTW